MATRFFAAAAITISPPTTRVSLFAKAIVLPASIAASVGRKPLNPTSATSTMSMVDMPTICSIDFAPA